MRTLRWISWLFLFIVLFGFAVKNTEMVNLYFYFNYTWQAPLVLLLFLFFAAGMFLGIVAMLPKLFQQSSNVRKLKKELNAPANHKTSSETIPYSG